MQHIAEYDGSLHCGNRASVIIIRNNRELAGLKKRGTSWASLGLVWQLVTTTSAVATGPFAHDDVVAH